MGKIIQFPTKDKHNQPHPSTKLERKIKSMQNMMDLKNKHIKQAYDKLINMEMESTNLEDKYDGVLQEYALRFGVDAINIQWLDYSKKLEFVLTEGGDIIMSFKDDSN